MTVVVTLQIKTFKGLGTWGQHYYATLRCEGKKATRLERVLDAEEAEHLNRYDNTPGSYKAGSLTERFFTADQARARAQEVWLKKYPEATLLEEIFE